MDTLHTNEERIEKIRCVLNAALRYTLDPNELQNFLNSVTLPDDIAAAHESLDAVEAFINQRNALDAI